MTASMPEPGRRYRLGFTLIEMLVAVAILAIIMVLASQMIGATGKIWKNTTAKLESFQGARDAFQLMADQLRQATVNTYWDYFNAAGQSRAQYNATSPTTPFVPACYARQSELHFISGPGLVPNQITHAVFFQAPLGFASNKTTYGALQNLLSASGFFIEFGDGTNVVNSAPSFLPGTQPQYRYRLMQFIQPTEQLAVYNYSLTSATAPNIWFTNPISTAHSTTVRVMATNVIGLILAPKQTDSATDTLAPAYAFDSRLGLNSGVAVPGTAWKPGINSQPLQMNQMPPIIRLAIIVLDEPSAKVLQGSGTTAPAKITAAFAQNNLNTDSKPLFTTAANLDSDLLYLQNGPSGLAKVTPHLNFRIFNTTTIVRSARFSAK